MKTITLLTGILIFGFQSLYAQVLQGTSNVNSGGGDLRFGAKAGFNFSTFTGNALLDASPTVGFYAGGLAEIPAFMDDFYLQPEILLSYQGADIGIGKLNQFYLQLPIMAKYHITEAIAVEAGPQLGFRLADNASDYTDSTTRGPLETNFFQLAFNVGCGYRLNDAIYFQLRFSPALTKNISTLGTSNLVVQVGASYFF